MNRRQWILAAAASSAGLGAAVWSITRAGAAPAAGYKIVAVYPHDPTAYTQGLTYVDGKLYESTGHYGQSALRQVELETGKIIREQKLKSDYFAEGLTNWKGTLVQLTWKNGVGFIYDQTNFKFIKSFPVAGEGWGLTHDGTVWYLSDGSSTIRVLDPSNQRVISTLKVRDRGQGVPRLNELEYINGEIYANVWQSDRVVRISPRTGDVLGWVDLTGLLPGRQPGQTSTTESGVDVLNGIAYDDAGKRLFVTGKNWPKLFEIKLTA